MSSPHPEVIDERFDRSAPDYHKLHPEAYEVACLEAHGAILGWMAGHGLPAPTLTPTLRVAYEQAVAVAFNRGYQAAECAPEQVEVRV